MTITDNTPAGGGILPKALPFVGIGLVYLLGAQLDVMEIDAAQYASISKEMMETGNYLQITNRHKDYLDKPPLLFWMAALFFKVFGVSNFVYRLPAMLFSALGIYSTYRLAKRYYGESVGYWAAVIIASTQAFFLMNHDVRTDTMLTASVVFAIWQLVDFQETRRFLPLVLGSVGVALAMLAKGPIGLIVPGAAFVVDWALKRQWRSFFQWQWLVAILIIALMLLPMSLGLYWQFDAQPEKGVSGLRFYYWTQSFGRITGESEWNNNPGLFFQAQNFLWSFLPWTLLFPPALWAALRQIWLQGFRLRQEQEGLTLGGFVLPFIALSLSKYQLPHYTYVVFPLGAILTARWLVPLLNSGRSPVWVKGLQVFTWTVLWLLASALCVWAFPFPAWWLWPVALGGLGYTLHQTLRGQTAIARVLVPSLVSIIAINTLLNGHVYPRLFQYQISSVLAKYVRYQTDISADRLFVFRRVFGDDRDIELHSLDFYSTQVIPDLPDTVAIRAQLKQGNCWLYADIEAKKEVEAMPNVSVEVLKQYDKFHISTLTLPFLNPAMREGEIDKVFLLLLKQN
ncbi:ArnT family glycosyltransferase [Eisenibacter elegans]|jgi:4-amino-4-deoxy-L-arabinose transferase-like glycosyltransferase|uniref:ArnT family glycosyltransferase n=1 Tax=Eisenibacter elegans TaxID=997 RepID=UPI000408F80D|nr:glycosyltransferase family 39 protein [Eisenibacter elegans]